MAKINGLSQSDAVAALALCDVEAGLDFVTRHPRACSIYKWHHGR